MVRFEIDLDKIYPVGSIYISVNDTNPKEYYGGEWERIEDKFLLACGTKHSNGSTGGEEKHTLNINEMPSHTHIQNQHRHGLNRNFSDGSGGSTSAHVQTADRKTSTKYTTYTTATNQNTGGGQAHNNMPPFLAVYMWVRVG